MTEWLFYIFGGLAVLSAALVLFTKNVLYAACALILTFLSISAIYVLSGAEFLAITQIMIYVGGIVVLMIFGVMLTNKLSGKAMTSGHHYKFFGALAGIGLLLVLYFSFGKLGNLEYEIVGQAENNISQIGIGLITDYILPFELAAVLLLVALIGAATVAAKEKNDKVDI